MNFTESDLERIAIDGPRLAPVLATLRGARSLWHRTSVESLKQILDHGAIEPNDGRFPETYPQSKSCYGRYIGAVCLFDFDTEPLDEILVHAWKWAAFLTDRGAATVLIRIARDALDPTKLTLPPEVKYPNMPRVQGHDGAAYVPTYIPRVEAWYRAPVRAAAFREFVLIKDGSDFEHMRVDLGPAALASIAATDRTWSAAAEAEQERRRAAGEFNIVEILRAARERTKK